MLDPRCNKVTWHKFRDWTNYPQYTPPQYFWTPTCEAAERVAGNLSVLETHFSTPDQFTQLRHRSQRNIFKITLSSQFGLLGNAIPKVEPVTFTSTFQQRKAAYISGGWATRVWLIEVVESFLLSYCFIIYSYLFLHELTVKGFIWPTARYHVWRAKVWCLWSF